MPLLPYITPLGRGRGPWQQVDHNRSLQSLCLVDNFVPNLPHSPEYRAKWDTGATSSAVSDRVAQERHLLSRGQRTVQTAASVVDLPVYLVNLTLPDIADIWLPVLGSPLGPEGDVLIGMDIVMKGQLTIRQRRGEAQWSFALRHSLPWRLLDLFR